MDRPDWCPHEVWTKAVGCCMEMQIRDMNTGCVIDAEIHVARAILAAKAEEREGCALVAMAAIEAGDERHEIWLERYDVAISIAAAIRKRGEA